MITDRDRETLLSGTFSDVQQGRRNINGSVETAWVMVVGVDDAPTAFSSMNLGVCSGKSQCQARLLTSHCWGSDFISRLMSTLPSIAYPGQALGLLKKYSAGPGTHAQDGQIYASLAGAPAVDGATNPATLSIPRLLPLPTSSHVPSINISNKNTLPRVGSIVLGKVTRCLIKQVNVAILVVDEQVCADEWSGVVRREDVRATEKEKVVIGEGFRVGDLIRGEVVCYSV